VAWELMWNAILSVTAVAARDNTRGGLPASDPITYPERRRCAWM